MVRVKGWGWSLTAAASVLGRSTGTPTVRRGAEIMKMISSTSITSTSGVTLISESAPRRPRRRRREPPEAAKASVEESAIGPYRSATRRWIAVDRSSAKPSRRAPYLPALVEKEL